MLVNKTLYHIHRSGTFDSLWNKSAFYIDNSFSSRLYIQLLETEKVLIERYQPDYDIDFIIAIMKEMKHKNTILDLELFDFNLLLNRFLILRREYALEEGRKLFAPSISSRMHSIFVTDLENLSYWISMVGKDSYQIFLLKLYGNLFVSSDQFFPDPNLCFDLQVEQSKNYWKPKVKEFSHKEFLFQGDVRIIR